MPVMTFGCPGGDDQAQANLQMMLNVLIFGMDPQAVEAPRFATQSVTNSFYLRSYYPGSLAPRGAHLRGSGAAVGRVGHEIVRVGACGIGAIVTWRDPDTGVLAAGADPRRPTYAIGFRGGRGARWQYVSESQPSPEQRQALGMPPRWV